MGKLRGGLFQARHKEFCKFISARIHTNKLQAGWQTSLPSYLVSEIKASPPSMRSASQSAISRAAAELMQANNGMPDYDHPAFAKNLTPPPPPPVKRPSTDPEFIERFRKSTPEEQYNMAVEATNIIHGKPDKFSIPINVKLVSSPFTDWEEYHSGKITHDSEVFFFDAKRTILRDFFGLFKFNNTIETRFKLPIYGFEDITALQTDEGMEMNFHLIDGGVIKFLATVQKDFTWVTITAKVFDDRYTNVREQMVELANGEPK